MSDVKRDDVGYVLGKAYQHALRLQPFELRFLAGKRAPDRLVIDLSSDSGVLLEPTDYPKRTPRESALRAVPEVSPL